MKVYAKNCFDRLGDDLTELILQYLTFEDKVRLECVSKQWRRLVFNKQFVIEIHTVSKRTKNSLDLFPKFKRDFRSINRKALVTVLKKCPNIMKVDINIDVKSKVLSLIGQYCEHIKSLKLNDISIDKKTLSFFRMYGHKLEELYVKNRWKEFEDTKQILEFCQNLRTINFGQISYYHYHDKVRHELDFLSVKYSQTIKTLNITLAYMTSKELKTCIEFISRCENLQSLTLYLPNLHDSEPIDDCLSLIGQKCNKLLKLDLIFGESVPISDQFFDIFSEFKAIKKLKIYITPENKVNGSVECFKHCKQLIDIDINYSELREDFFANIASFVPKLQSLRIRTDYRFSDTFINNFNSMKNILRVNYVVDSKTQTIWYFGKSLSEVMLSPNGKYIIRVNDNCGYL